MRPADRSKNVRAFPGDHGGRWAAALALGMALAVSACAGAPGPLRPTGNPPPVADRPAVRAPARGPVHEPPPAVRYETGVASWYGAGYHGRRTASGQRFNKNALTAAHPNLPFGTRIRVTNMANGRSVVLVVNDRGPFTRGRILDVSRRGAELLGFVRAGTARVRVEVLGMS